MRKEDVLSELSSQPRRRETATPGEPSLGPLKHLPGLWKNTWTAGESRAPPLSGRGWNMIALPFIAGAARPAPDYRILMNRYNEELRFREVDKGVPNRGVIRDQRSNRTQKIVALDYEQVIRALVGADFPRSAAVPPPTNPDGDLAGGRCADATGERCPVIHHEPGLWLNILDFEADDVDIGRLGTIPHGNSVLALGRSQAPRAGAPQIADVSVLPLGGPANMDHPYLAPYVHFRDAPFDGLFNVLEPGALLRRSTPANVVTTTTLAVDTTLASGGVVNIPFIRRHADVTSMRSTFWIMELDERDARGDPVFVLQYMQVVMLAFFDRFDGAPGLIQWPHVSFNTLRRFPAT